MGRIDKENYYLDIAQTVAERATCLRRCYGAILVKSDEIIATGYNGAPRGRRNCVDLNYCTREALNIPSGQRYELCRSVHAEANAIISAARSETIGATLYMACVDPATGELIAGSTSCSMYPQHQDGLLGGPCGGLDPGGRLPAPDLTAKKPPDPAASGGPSTWSSSFKVIPNSLDRAINLSVSGTAPSASHLLTA